MIEFLTDFWTVLVAALNVTAAAAATAHVVLCKREERAVIGWVGLIILVPIFGSLLYALLGINRIHRRAKRLRPRSAGRIALSESWRQSGESVAERLNEPEAGRLIRLVDRLVHHPPISGNRIELLENGEEAYPAMWEAIDGAQSTISLMTYIFETDSVGHRFIDALMKARDRGVEVRVLIDGVGARYSRPPAKRLLENLGIPVAHFLPSIVPSSFRYSNLRNHRKVLVADGCLAFTGGMNIRDGHMPSRNPKHPIQDLHARLAGPIVTQLQEVFLDDWQFATGEDLDEELWISDCQAAGEVILRAIPDGPDENFDVLRQTLLGAISVAERRIAIVTPYFLPDETVISALNTAALRGVRVDIILPEKNNLRLVQWASRPFYPWLLEKGCRIWHSPPPFEHTKLMLVDDYWTFIGSGNWDARSLRLNFELNVEAYSNHLAAEVRAMIDSRIERSRSVSLAEAEQLSFPVRLRNGFVRLATPYL